MTQKCICDVTSSFVLTAWLPKPTAESLFKRETVHSIIHDPETAENGLASSLSHKYTSDWWGNPKSTSPAVPTAPQPVNVFSVYSGGDWIGFFER